jgi:hypothetical protein
MPNKSILVIEDIDCCFIANSKPLVLRWSDALEIQFFS